MTTPTPTTAAAGAPPAAPSPATERPTLPTTLSDNLYLIHFAQIHETFRRAELDALATLHSIPLQWHTYSATSPFALAVLPSPAAAALLVKRAILTKAIYTLWGSAGTPAALHTLLRARTPALAGPCMGRTFKFTIESYHLRRSAREQTALIESFSYLGLDGRIRMRGAELEFVVFEEFTAPTPGRDPTLLWVALGLRAGEGARGDIERFDLKKRSYIGTTSMDAELSLVTGNMALAAPGRVAYDPFCGTGSFLVACAHLGALTLGSDIDGRQVRGRKGRSVVGNMKQYGLTARYLDGFVSDLTNTPLRKGQWIDAVVCDPPYGVREGLKVLGHRDAAKNGGEPVVRNGVLRHTEDDYVPPKKPYSFTAMLADILQFAVDYVVPGGRLCFWMPTENEDEHRKFDIPMHPQLKLVNVSVQEFNKWSRCLLTYSRRPGDEGLAEHLEMQRARAEAAVTDKLDGTADELNDFRKKYFEGFRPSSTPTPTPTTTTTTNTSSATAPAPAEAAPVKDIPVASAP
ncbi:S-adenosyl-L-methionine-dependent methyltransferase [Geopyxis carbonaria]|nr:S-adenosyl-L-methionine-dependent methyltransferase [Geopyxis carbonaria]